MVLLAGGNNSKLKFIIEDISWTESNLTMYSLANSILIYQFDIQLKDMQTGTRSVTAAWSSSQKICDIHLLFWHHTISLASLAVCD